MRNGAVLHSIIRRRYTMVDCEWWLLSCCKIVSREFRTKEEEREAWYTCCAYFRVMQLSVAVFASETDSGQNPGRSASPEDRHQDDNAVYNSAAAHRIARNNRNAKVIRET
ncbi:uncharacterized protein LOC143897439 [Temnothorax americanus]|uniref:uncharacterized protein LOC143897439 n=1 Tax=Temnothorax americanus TaxID=1964332 RepID=UPI00406904CC